MWNKNCKFQRVISCEYGVSNFHSGKIIWNIYQWRSYFGGFWITTVMSRRFAKSTNLCWMGLLKSSSELYCQIIFETVSPGGVFLQPLQSGGKRLKNTRNSIKQYIFISLYQSLVKGGNDGNSVSYSSITLKTAVIKVLSILIFFLQKLNKIKITIKILNKLHLKSLFQYFVFSRFSFNFLLLPFYWNFQSNCLCTKMEMISNFMTKTSMILYWHKYYVIVTVTS